MSATRWLYSVVEFVGDRAQVTVLMSNAEHVVTAVGTHDEMFTIIAQMGAEGWELSVTDHSITTLALRGITRTDVRRLWFKKPLEG